jgi:hypothetical protein
MKSITRWMPALVAGLVLVSACDSAPATAPLAASTARPVVAAAAEHQVEEALYQMEGVYVTFGCTADGVPPEDHEGELIALQGQIYERFALRRDAMGGYHITQQVMPVGLSGVSVVSGEEFRVVERAHEAYNQTQAGFNGRWRYEVRLTGTQTKRTFLLIASGMYRLSAEGDIVVERDEFTTVCR